MALRHLGGIGLDLVAAIEAPHDQPHTGRRGVAERPPPSTLVSAYPEKSPYGLPPRRSLWRSVPGHSPVTAVLLAAIQAEIGRNPSLAPSPPKAGKFIWNPSTRQHERQGAL